MGAGSTRSATRSTRADLVAENASLSRKLARAEKKIARLEEENARLLARIEEVTRAGKRQAAPFSKGDPKPDPKTPGRKPRRGRKRGGPHDSRPAPTHVDEVINVPLPETCECGGRLIQERIADQFQEDIPPVKPIVRQFRVAIGACEDCGRRAQPRHPLQTSDALGAAAVQLGPNVLSYAMLLRERGGASWEKVADFITRGFGITADRSTFCRAARRLTSRIAPTYDALVKAVAESPVVSADETGWKVAGERRWLWVFTTRLITVFTIAASRGSDVIVEVMGESFSGVLCRDGWSAYGCLTEARHQTCVAHLMRRAHEILEVAKRGAAKFATGIKGVLKAALDLRDRRDELTDHGFASLRGKIEARLDWYLGWDPQYKLNAVFRRHLAKERDHIFTFLYEEDVEATNWQAEQAIRPAVLARKVSGGNRSDLGAETHAVLASVIRTACLQKRDPLALMIEAFRAPTPIDLGLLPEPHD